MCVDYEMTLEAELAGGQRKKTANRELDVAMQRLTPAEAHLFLQGYRCGMWGIAYLQGEVPLERLLDAFYDSAGKLQETIGAPSNMETDIGWKALQGAVERMVDPCKANSG